MSDLVTNDNLIIENLRREVRNLRDELHGIHRELWETRDVAKADRGAAEALEAIVDLWQDFQTAPDAHWAEIYRGQLDRVIQGHREAMKEARRRG